MRSKKNRFANVYGMDNLLHGYLKTLEGIIGKEVDEVEWGFEGEPLSWTWKAPREGRLDELFVVAFDDRDLLMVNFWGSIEESVRMEGEWRHIPVGRTPSDLVQAMKAWRRAYVHERAL
jgi:hypothetical protein